MGLLRTVGLRGGLAAARHILQLEDRRTAQLNRLARAVDAGLKGPYQAGLQHLELAGKADANAESSTRHLALAEELFVVAFGNLREVDPLQSAWAAVNLAVICSATKRQSEALYWAEAAHERASVAADQAARELADHADSRFGRLRLTSENTEAGVIMGGAAATGIGAAAAGITIASGGLAIVAVGAALGVSLAAGKGIQMYRSHHLKARDAKAQEMAEFVADIVSMRESLSDRQLPSA